jgi:hypothetical protein
MTNLLATADHPRPTGRALAIRTNAVYVGEVRTACGASVVGHRYRGRSCSKQKGAELVVKLGPSRKPAVVTNQW